MRPKTTIAFLILAAAALAYFFFVEQPRHKRRTEEIADAGILTKLEASDIDRVSIQRPDLTLAFERRADVWMMLEPVADKADERAINVLLLEISRARIGKRFTVEPSGYGEYGLDNPAATVRLSTQKEADALVLHIGDQNLNKSYCFARIASGGGVLMLPAALRRYALRSAFEYRNKRVFETPVSDIGRIRLAAAGGVVDWSRDKAGSWFAMVMNDTIRGDETRIDDIVRELRGLRAKDIPYPVTDPRIYLADIAGTITLWTLTAQDTTTIEFESDSDSTGTCYVAVSPPGRVSLVESIVLRVFAYTYNQLRDRRILDFDPASVARIEFDGPGTKAVITRTGSNWAFANPEFGAIKTASVEKFLDHIGKFEYAAAIEERLADAGGYGFPDPAYRLALFDTGGGIVDELKTGDPLPDTTYRYVTSRSTGVLASVDAGELARLLAEFQNVTQ